MTPDEAETFYEDDEDPAKVRAAFEAGEHFVTRKPPAFDEDTKLDFSRFHPLDHWLFGCWRRNASQPIHGKTWYHLKTAWEYKWRSDLRAATLCRVGIGHYYGTAWRRSEPSNPKSEWVPIVPRHCIWCMKDEP